MEPYQKALIKACKKLKLKYEIPHKNAIAIKVLTDPALFFVHHFIPVNHQDVCKICTDKDLSYTLFRKTIQIPKWKSYLDPNSNRKYQNLIKNKSIESIATDIIANFQLPVVLKMNQGSLGINIFICNSLKEIKNALAKIFNKNQKKYDYLAIAQEFIEINREFRIIMHKKKVLLAYEKDINNAIFTENISPETWENSKDLKINSISMQQKLEAFVKPVFDIIPIEFFGADIAEDKTGNLYLLEINHSPMFNHYIKDNGDEDIIKVYENLLINQ
ncbi:hypothetical protein JW887_01280 [Candidatus Dojkabacteria bacterium]|nr:hypothetical protein [Candidatus Dojkabacteria bacterium]